MDIWIYMDLMGSLTDWLLTFFKISFVFRRENFNVNYSFKVKFDITKCTF